MRQLTWMMGCALIVVLSGMSAQAQVEYVDMGFDDCLTCEPGIPVCSKCMQANCDGKCQRIFRRLGFYGGGVIDIPLEGMFSSSVTRSLSAAGLAIDPAVLPAATQVRLDFEEMGFDDVYSAFYGYNANLTIEMDSATKVFVGYREVFGEADEIEIGQATIDPFGAPTTESLLAQFSDYEEYSIRLGFITSKQWHSKLEFLWGGQGGVAFTDAITGTLSIPEITTLEDLPFYQDSTILTFGVNFGLRWNAKPNVAFVAMTGAEYRTSLDEDDSVLPTFGLENLNNGAGFTTLPIYLGFTVKL